MTDKTEITKRFERGKDSRGEFDVSVKIDVEGVGGERALQLADDLYLAVEQEYISNELGESH